MLKWVAEYVNLYSLHFELLTTTSPCGVISSVGFAEIMQQFVFHSASMTAFLRESATSLNSRRMDAFRHQTSSSFSINSIARFAVLINSFITYSLSTLLRLTTSIYFVLYPSTLSHCRNEPHLCIVAP